MDIPHILYNTVGNDFEKFLGPEELLTMSKVSKTTREGDISRKFRHLLEVTLQKFEIFKKNNRGAVTIDDFFINIPLGVIYKNHVLEEGTDFNLLIDYYNMRIKARECMAIEFGILSNGLKWQDAIFQASIRGRDELVEVLYKSEDRKYRHKFSYRYYSASKRLVDLFIKNEKRYLHKLEKYNGIDSDGYALNQDNDQEELRDFVTLATCFQEQDIFIKYYLQTNEEVPYYLRKTLYNTSLKYNIDRYDSRVEIYEPD